MPYAISKIIKGKLTGIPGSPFRPFNPAGPTSPWKSAKNDNSERKKQTSSVLSRKYFDFQVLCRPFQNWRLQDEWHNYNIRHKSLTQKLFFLNFLQISYIHSSHLYSHSKQVLSFPNVGPRILWSTETTVIPKSTLGKGKITQVFQDLWRVLQFNAWMNLNSECTFACSCYSSDHRIGQIQ